MAGLILWGAHQWWVCSAAWVKTDNAYVAAHIHSVSSRIPGSVTEVLVEENQEVHAGAVLARLDRRDLEVKREEALAQLGLAQAESQRVEGLIARTRAELVREQALSKKAALDLRRAQTLFEDQSGAISAQEYDQAKADSESADAVLKAAEAALVSAKSQLAAAQAQEKVALAGLREAELQLSYTDITAPADGRIGRRNIETGNRVQPGQALFSLVQSATWVTANFKETQLARLKPGQRAVITVDAFPGRAFEGYVEGISPASGAQFALLPPDNATGNFTRIVQRVPVKLVFDKASLGEFSARLVPGMSVLAEVNVR